MTELDVDNMDFELPTPKTVASQQVDATNWICIYPIYFDSLMPTHRKVPLQHAVADPDLSSVIEAAAMAGLQFAVERKKHPADHLRLGRLRVQPTLSKKQVLMKIATCLKETIQTQPQRRQEAVEYVKQRIRETQPSAMVSVPSRSLRIAQLMGASGKVPVDMSQFEAIPAPKAATKSKKK